MFFFWGGGQPRGREEGGREGSVGPRKNVLCTLPPPRRQALKNAKSLYPAIFGDSSSLTLYSIQLNKLLVSFRFVSFKKKKMIGRLWTDQETHRQNPRLILD